MQHQLAGNIGPCRAECCPDCTVSSSAHQRAFVFAQPCWTQHAAAERACACWDLEPSISLHAVALPACCPHQVASEDTVLDTAQAYVDAVTPYSLQRQLTAKQLLAQLVRCQHLSYFWLTAAPLTATGPSLLLSSLTAQLKQLLMVRAGLGDGSLAHSELQQWVQGAPDSWTLDQRAIRPVDAVALTWRVDIAKLASTARLSASQKQLLRLRSELSHCVERCKSKVCLSRWRCWCVCAPTRPPDRRAVTLCVSDPDLCMCCTER